MGFQLGGGPLGGAGLGGGGIFGGGGLIPPCIYPCPIPVGGGPIGGWGIPGGGPYIGIKGFYKPTPWAGPAKPGIGPPIMCGGKLTYLLIGTAFAPGYPWATPPPTVFFWYWLGGASAQNVTILSPLISTRPMGLLTSCGAYCALSGYFYSSSFLFFLGFIVLYSSVSVNTKFMCLSYEIRVPTRYLSFEVSCSYTLIL